MRKMYKSAPKLKAPIKSCANCKHADGKVDVEPCNTCYESTIPFLPKWEKR